MKILCVDPGSVRIGIAISDESGSFARPLQIIKHISRSEDSKYITKIASENDCSMIVVGVALDSFGEIGPRARTSLRLITAIQENTKIPVIAWDESYSSQIVRKTQMERKVTKKRRNLSIDDQAAAIILSDFLLNFGNNEKLKNENGT